MKLFIVGQDTLYRAVSECCGRHFDVLTSSQEADVLWFCYDTPIGGDDVPDSEWVLNQIRNDLSEVEGLPLVLLSSQMPVGTIAKLEKEFPRFHFGYSPENLRVATAVSDFEKQNRVVVGVRNWSSMPILQELFEPFTELVIFTNPETAEMVKHALNTFLALQIAFINEIARVSATVGADVDKITAALRTEARISPKAPLKAGLPYGGGHLARDIHVLSELAAQNGLPCPIISHIKESNSYRNNAG